MNETKLVGFVHQYGKDDFSMWNVQLSKEDEEAINKILAKYEANGFSIRGNSKMTLEEGF